jgi:hypothetical protein
MPTIPAPIRAGLGLLDTTISKARDLVDRAPELPMQVVGNALQLTMKAQQTFTELTIRGDEVIGRLRGVPAEPPSWATFDDELPTATGADLLTDDMGVGSNLSRFDAVRDTDYAPQDDLPADSSADFPVASNLDDPASLVGFAETMLEESAEPLVEAPAARRADAVKSPAKKAPAKQAPTKRAPVKTAPAKTAPTKQAPVKTAPVKTAPAKTAPVKTAPAKTAPAKTAPAKKAPAKKAALAQKFAPPKSTAPARKSPVQKSTVKKSPVKKTSARSASKFDLAGDLQAALDEPTES